jgi:DNA-directed RNA polymerase sigma subunit (sigma70/sigma32)
VRAASEELRTGLHQEPDGLEAVRGLSVFIQMLTEERDAASAVRFERVGRLREQGVSLGRIATQAGVTRNAVSQMERRYLDKPRYRTDAERHQQERSPDE